MSKDNPEIGVCQHCGLPSDLCVCKAIESDVRLNVLLKCQICGIPFRKLDEHTYEPNCRCIRKKIRV